MTIHKKLVFAMVSIAVLSMGSYLVVASWQSQRQAESARNQIKELVDSSTVDTSAAIRRLIAAQDETLRKEVDTQLNVAKAILSHAGPITFSPEMVRWTATNQFTLQKHEVKIPKMLFNGKWLGQNKNFNIRTPIIDDEHDLVGGTVTLFQRMNARGDMLRIATDVRKDCGDRAIGTFIPRFQSDGTPNPVLQAVLNGRTYRGVAWIVGHYYVTCYQPLRNSKGDIIGAIYTGEREEYGIGLRGAIMNAQVGKTGRILILSGKGDKKGTCIVSSDDRNGKDLTNATDADGRRYAVKILKAASQLSDGQSAIIRYRLIEHGKPVDVTARVAYYRPWDWVIVTEAHPADFADVFERLYNSGNATVVAFLLICFAMVVLTLPLLWADANERARREAERANEAKSDFLSRMSHELRTPLNAILGFAQILEMDELTDDQTDSVSHIRIAGQHLLSLINEVLDMSRIESGAMLLSIEPIELRALAMEVRALIHPLAESRNIEVTVEFAEGEEHYVSADRQRMLQVLINLVSNGIKYNHLNGSVRIDGRPSPQGHYRIQVTDTGPGISPDRIGAIFTPFDRLGAEKTEIEGTGLGLALSKHLVEQMKGKIFFETSTKGTTFFVDMPRASAPVITLEVPASGDEAVVIEAFESHAAEDVA